MTTWVVLRAAGFGAYVMLFLSVCWGLVATTGALGKRVSKATAASFHQFLSTVGLVLLAIHIALVLIDSFMEFGPRDVLVPGASTYRPVAVAFGILGMYAMVFVVVASWLRKPLGARWWRRTHLLAVPIFIFSLLHGVFAGSDTVRPALWWGYVTTGSIVLFLLILRALTAGFRPEQRPRPVRATVTRRADDSHATTHTGDRVNT